MTAADSAGVPWEGRHFEPNPHAADDGSAPPALMAALSAFRSGSAGAEAVVDAVRASRLLIPLVAELGDFGHTDDGLLVDKSQELSIVTVAGPDGRDVLPVFSSVDTMRAWDAEARPVPADGVRVALAAAAEHTDLVVIDAGSPGEFVLRRPALWAIARELDWSPSHADAAVHAAFEASVVDEPAITAISLESGDPESRLEGPELLVRLALRPGLAESELEALISRLQHRWVADETIVERVDSMSLKLAPAVS